MTHATMLIFSVVDEQCVGNTSVSQITVKLSGGRYMATFQQEASETLIKMKYKILAHFRTNEKILKPRHTLLKNCVTDDLPKKNRKNWKN